TTSSSSSTSASSTSSSTSASSTSSSTSTSSSSGTTAFVPKNVFTILLENHDYSSIIGSSSMPYVNSPVAHYRLATNYMDSGTHPSLPNYLYLISGATQYLGVLDFDPTQNAFGTQFPVNADNLGNQLQVAGVKWRSYQESAGGNCVLSGVGEYAP